VALMFNNSFVFSFQILRSRGSTRSGISVHDRSNIPRPEARERSGETRRTYNAFRLRPLIHMPRKNSRENIFTNIIERIFYWKKKSKKLKKIE